MKRWRTRILLLAGGAALAVAIPALAQRDKGPQSLLPPGFGEQPPPPKEKAPERPAAPAATPAAPTGSSPAPATPSTTPPEAAPGIAGVVESDEPAVENNATAAEVENQDESEQPQAIEIPDFARRPTNIVGPLTPMNWGLGQDEFGNANGVFLAGLMRRLDAPLPSRWES